MLSFGHRGAKGYEPENTLLSINKALDLGVYGIEIDIHAVHGELLVVHDSWIMTQNIKRPLNDFTLDELRSFDVGKGEKIPFLSEVLNLIAGRVTLNIEIKGEGAVSLLVNQLTKSKSSGYNLKSIIISSFHHKELQAFHAAMPEVSCGLLLYGVPLRIAEDARSCGCQSVHLHIESVTTELVQEIHSAGMKVFVYTVNAPEEIAKMRALGVDGVFSDYPDRI